MAGDMVLLIFIDFVIGSVAVVFMCMVLYFLSSLSYNIINYITDRDYPKMYEYEYIEWLTVWLSLFGYITMCIVCIFSEREEVIIYGKLWSFIGVLIVVGFIIINGLAYCYKNRLHIKNLFSNTRGNVVKQMKR